MQTIKQLTQDNFRLMEELETVRATEDSHTLFLSRKLSLTDTMASFKKSVEL